MKYLFLGLLAGVATGSSLMAGTTVSGLLSTNTIWRMADSPCVLTGSVMVAEGATLTIEPGTEVQFGAKTDLVITNGGRLLAAGTTTAPIRFTGIPGSKERWGGLVVIGGVGSPETRITHAHFEGNDFSAIYSAGGTVLLDHLSFGQVDRQYVSLDRSSFLISHCQFPHSTGAFELVHGLGGIKSGGRGIIRDCFFGGTSGYNDIVDFTGGNRERKQPIVQFYNNVFAGATDDEIDLDGTDAWIEGNIFLHVHKNGAPDTASAISGGNKRRDTSQVTVIGNLFFDCDQAVTAKEGNFFALLNNTIVHMTRTGGLDTADGAVCMQDLDPRPTTFGEGVYLEGNIVVDVNQLVRNYASNETVVTFNNNVLPIAWAGPGRGNLIGDPRLKHLPQLAESQFTNWADAQVLRDWFSLMPGSPARGAGPGGRDLGGVVPLGAAVSGEPAGVTAQNTAVLAVGPNRTGCGIPTAGWPLGAGYSHYRWRLDAGAWSEETPIATVITLTDLAAGPHYVEVIGKRDSGWYQNDPALGPDAVITRSKTWMVQANK